MRFVLHGGMGGFPQIMPAVKHAHKIYLCCVSVVYIVCGQANTYAVYCVTVITLWCDMIRTCVCDDFEQLGYRDKGVTNHEKKWLPGVRLLLLPLCSMMVTLTLVMIVTWLGVVLGMVGTMVSCYGNGPFQLVLAVNHILSLRTGSHCAQLHAHFLQICVHFEVNGVSAPPIKQSCFYGNRRSAVICKWLGCPVT